MRPIRALATAVLTVTTLVFGLPGLPAGVRSDIAQADPPPNPLEITTWAGSGDNATVDGIGTAASFTSMGGVVVVGGHAYVGTAGSIRKVDLSTKEVTKWAGHPTELWCRDDPDRNQVRFGNIIDIDSDGTYLYTTGTCGYNTSLRKTSLATGETTTIVDDGVGHLTVAPNGMIYTSGGQGIEEIDPDTGQSSQFAWLTGNGYAITSDSSYIYLAWSPNTGGVVIDRFNYQGGQSSFSSTPEIGLVVLESVGEYLYGVGNGSRIRRYAKVDTSHVTVAGAGPSGYQNGSGTDAWFNNITGIASDGTALYISDDLNYRLRKGEEGSPLPSSQLPSATTDLGINPAAVDTTAGNGQPGTIDETGELAGFSTMGGLVVVDGFAYIATTGAIRKVDLATREVTTFAGHDTEQDCDADSTDRSQVRFEDITDLDTDGYYLYTANQCGNEGRIRRTSLATGATSTIYSDFGLQYLTVGPDGMIYSSGGQGVDKIDPIEGTATQFDWLIGHGHAIASDDTHIWLTWIPGGWSGVPQIDMYDLAGNSTTFATEAVGQLALESAGGYLYAVDDSLSALRVYEKATGAWVNIAGGTWGYRDGTGTGAEFAQISGIASDGHNLWISDQQNYRLRKAVQGQQLDALAGSCGQGDVTITRCSFESDPVNTATGSFYHHVTDARLPGIGVPFELARHYNSLDSATGPFGQGWSHSYNASLAMDQDGNAVLRTEDGKQVPFTLQEDGSFWGGPGTRASLETVEDGYELITHSQLHYLFDSQGRLVSLEDRSGQGLTFTYQGTQLDLVTDSAGREIDLQYQGDLLSSVVLPGGRHVDYGYTGGQLTTVTDLRGGTTTYTYDGQGRMDTIVDQNQHTVVDNTYGPTGRITHQIDAMGEEGTFDWNPDTETSTFTDAKGKIWTDDYENGVLVSQTDPLGNMTTYGYSGLDLTSITDPRGHTATMTYDDRGNLLEREAPAPLSYDEQFTYDAQNNLTSHTDGRDHTTTYEYDASGNLVKITEPGTIVTEFGRDPGSGLISSITDPRGKTTTFDHDAQGNLTEVTAPSGDLTTMGHDPSGRMTSKVEARGNEPGANPADYTWTYTYDDADHQLTQTDPLGNQTEWAYDPVGNLDSVTDANDHVREYGYNAANELTSVTAPDDTITSYGYDEVGNLTSRTDTETHVTDYGYDDARRLIEVESPIGQRWGYEYDASGNVKKVITARGMATPAPGDGTITYSYDELNRLTGIDYSDTTPDVGIEYDANGNRTEMTDGSGTVAYAWDSLNRLTSVTRGADTFSYAYDPAGNVTRRTYPDATVVDYTYSNNGQLATVVTGGTTTSYEYDPAGNLVLTTLPPGNGHKETRIYDHAGRPTEVKNAKGQTVLSKFTYTLDDVGNPTQVVTPTSTTTYQYDELDRLTEVCFQASCPLSADPFIRWAYDGVGNRTSEDRPAGTTTYAYNDADQLTSRTGPGGTVNYTYDDDGNQTAAGSRTFAFDLADRLTSTTSGSATTTYTYDGDDRRLLASTGAQASQKTKYLWDPNWPLYQLALERNGAGTLRRRYVHGNDLVSMFTGGKAYYYHYDALGSTANLTSNTGAKQWTYAYEPFGTIRTETKNNTNAPVNPMRFTGELFDTDTGLYHLRARQYDSGTGRFLATDPLPSPPADPYVSAYAYANNQPTALIDPTGLRGRPFGWEDCPWPKHLPGIGDLYCEGFLSMGPTWQGIWGATVEAAPPALGVGLLGQACVVFVDKCAALSVAVGVHGPHHNFEGKGPRSHLFFNWWFKGVSGSDHVKQWPFPW